MQPIIITKGQKKIFLIVGIVLSILILFLLFAYFPLRSKQDRLKAEINLIEADIESIKKIAKGGATIEEAITILKNKLEELDKKFPAHEELVLRSLSELAAKMNIEVSSMTPQKKKTVTDIDGSPVMVRGGSVQEMAVSMNFKTNYKTLAEFLRILEDDFPVSVKIKTVQLSKQGNSSSGVLDVTLNLDAYLIAGK